MEPKDYEDLYRVGDSQLLRQMSIDNANMALNLAQRINGEARYKSLLDRLKKEFMNYKLLTIENIESIAGTEVHYKGNKFFVDSVERTSTTYNFIVRKHYFIGADTEIKMVLSRVMDGRVYTITNEESGAYQRVGKELLKDKNEFLKALVSLTDELPF
jgi:hypothetical protein